LEELETELALAAVRPDGLVAPGGVVFDPLASRWLPGVATSLAFGPEEPVVASGDDTGWVQISAIGGGFGNQVFPVAGRRAHGPGRTFAVWSGPRELVTAGADGRILRAAVDFARDSFPLETLVRHSLAVTALAPLQPERVVFGDWEGSVFSLRLGEAPVALREGRGVSTLRLEAEGNALLVHDADGAFGVLDVDTATVRWWAPGTAALATLTGDGGVAVVRANGATELLALADGRSLRSVPLGGEPPLALHASGDERVWVYPRGPIRVEAGAGLHGVVSDPIEASAVCFQRRIVAYVKGAHHLAAMTWRGSRE
jgi:hypothetical protein